MKTVSNAGERTVVGFARLGFPEVPLVGRYAYARAHPPLRQHVHRNAFEVCVLQHGTQTYAVGGARFSLSAGDMIITKPGEVHGTGTEPENRGRLYWVQFVRPGRGHAFLDLSAPEAQRLFDRLSRLTACHFHQSEVLIPTFERILASAIAAPAVLPKAHIRNLLTRLILDLAELTRRTEPPRCSPDIYRALRHLNERSADHLSVASLARLAGMSASLFKARFRQEVGMTPMECLLWCRTERAKRLLRDTERTITAIALDAGFATSQHFATAFKRLTDCTPSEFRRRSRSSSGDSGHPAAGVGPRFHPVAFRTGRGKK